MSGFQKIQECKESTVMKGFYLQREENMKHGSEETLVFFFPFRDDDRRKKFEKRHSRVCGERERERLLHWCERYL